MVRRHKRREKQIWWPRTSICNPPSQQAVQGPQLLLSLTRCTRPSSTLNRCSNAHIPVFKDSGEPRFAHTCEGQNAFLYRESLRGLP